MISPQMAGLVNIIITKIPSLNYISSSFFDGIPRLETLDLSNNSLHFLPLSISKCQNLRVINLSRNFIVNVPSSIGKLSKLMHFDISHNRIKNLPCSLSQLRLDVIDITGNKFSAVKSPSIPNRQPSSLFDASFDLLCRFK